MELLSPGGGEQGKHNFCHESYEKYLVRESKGLSTDLLRKLWNSLSVTRVLPQAYCMVLDVYGCMQILTSTRAHAHA